MQPERLFCPMQPTSVHTQSIMRSILAAQDKFKYASQL